MKSFCDIIDLTLMSFKSNVFEEQMQMQGGIRLDFTFITPDTEKELKAQLSDRGSFLMAGGTDLLVKVRIGKIKPRKVISTLKVSTLHFLEDKTDELVIGATITHSELMKFKPLTRDFPILHDAIFTIGSAQIRNRGTLVGNIVNASPAGDGLLALYLLNAKVEFSDGSIIPIEEFVIGPGQTTLPAGEYVRAIHIPKDKWDIHYFEKVGQRNSMTISVASVGWLIKCKNGVMFSSERGGRTIEEFRIAYGSVAPTVLRLRDVEEFAKGKHIDEEFVHSISEMVKKDVHPIDDVRGSAEYRKTLCANLVYRMIEEEVKC